MLTGRARASYRPAAPTDRSDRLSLARDLSHGTTQRVVDRFGLTEVNGDDGGPYMKLSGDNADGECRVWIGDNVERVVSIGLGSPATGLDSHTIFAFSPTASALPHFTLDAVSTSSGNGFHLDLIPRVDLVTNSAYASAVYQPLTASFDAARALDGLTPARLGPRQIALMSPWLLAFRATDQAFGAIRQHVNSYHEHWATVVEAGLDVPVDLDPERLAARDAAHRSLLFDPEVDPVWDQIADMIGDESTARLRALLRNEE